MRFLTISQTFFFGDALSPIRPIKKVLPNGTLTDVGLILRGLFFTPQYFHKKSACKRVFASTFFAETAKIFSPFLNQPPPF